MEAVSDEPSADSKVLMALSRLSTYVVSQAAAVVLEEDDDDEEDEEDDDVDDEDEDEDDDDDDELELLPPPPPHATSARVSTTIRAEVGRPFTWSLHFAYDKSRPDVSGPRLSAGYSRSDSPQPTFTRPLHC